MEKFNRNPTAFEIELYREIFDNHKVGYQNFCNICWHIRLIMHKDIEKLDEKESQIRLYIEMKED